jgi:hypothetical protein
MRTDIPTTTESQAQTFPRARAVIEFVEGDLSRPPIIYPMTGGSDEDDEAVRREILKRWSGK